MIPLRDVIPSRTTPIVTIAIIGLNVALFLFELSLSAPALQQVLRDHGVTAGRFTWTSVVTSMFLHGGWLHLLGNMVYLWIFGENVEDRLGHGRFLVFYLLCGTTAVLAQAAASPGSLVPIVGSSGAIAGVMGAYFVLYPNSRVLTLVPLIVFWDVVEIPAIFFLGFWFLLPLGSAIGSIARTAVGDAAFWAQAIGFLTGLLAVFLFRRRERLRVEWWSD